MRYWPNPLLTVTKQLTNVCSVEDKFCQETELGMSTLACANTHTHTHTHTHTDFPIQSNVFEK